MNKIKMGKFLKELRVKKGITMNELIDELSSEHLTVTTKTIVDWEAGKTIPELEKLFFLARYYNVTIDEILDGECFLKEKDFLEEYPLYSVNFTNIMDWNSFYEMRDKCIKKINNRFLTLIKKIYSSELTHNEKSELKFIFKHKCKLSDSSLQRSHDDFFSFYGELKDLKNNPNIKNFSDYWWEAQKVFDDDGDYITSFDFRCVVDERIKTDNWFFEYLVNNAEPWQMDMVVAGFQNFDPIFYNADQSSKLLEAYKKEHGKEFDREEIYKSTLKFLLTHGGMINPYFFSFYQKKIEKIKVIDRLEELYKLCLRPLEIYMIDDERQGFQKRFLIENTPFNRFLNEYYSFAFCLSHERGVEDLNPKTLYNLVLNDENNEKIVELFCKYKNIDMNRDRKYVLADLDFDLKYWHGLKDKYLQKEKEIEAGLEEIKALEELLKNKIEYCEKSYIEEVGPKSWHELYGYIKRWKQAITLSEFKKERSAKLTQELLKEIDVLTIQEIRNKYFAKQVLGGSNND